MNASDWEQLIFIAAVTAVTAPLLGRYLAATFRGAGATQSRAPGDRVFLPVERVVYRALRIDPESSWTWRGYALAVLAFGLLSTLLLYLSVVGALVLVSQGAVQNFSGFRAASTLAGGSQQIPGGPVTSMEVIKLLGTNGGSFYGAGGAHPFENPNGFSNMFDLLLVIVLPFAIAIMFGRLIGRKRQGYAIVAVMAIIFLGHTVVSMQAEGHGNQLLPASVSQVASGDNPGGNMEGKETVFGPGGSALMTVGTMGTTAGATDSALDSYTRVFTRARGPRSTPPGQRSPCSCSG